MKKLKEMWVLWSLEENKVVEIKKKELLIEWSQGFWLGILLSIIFITFTY